jgi:hypothetical protein
MDTTLGPATHAHDTFAFQEATAVGRLRRRFRREERALPTADEPDPRPVMVDVVAKAVTTFAIVTAVVVAGALAIVVTLFGFAGVVSLITG